MASDVQGNNSNSFKQEYDADEDSQAQYDADECSNDEKPENIGSASVNGSAVDSPKYVRLRGLPWSATHQEILNFLTNVNVVNGSKGIHLMTSRWDGKNTGEAYVEVQSQDDVDEALKLNKKSMAHRYIEVFATNAKDAKEAMRKTGNHGMSYVVKLRGLPYAVTEQQIEEFFTGLEIKPDREGILFLTDRRGRATGEAFVQFESQEDTELALGLNREKIGHRYIEIFRSSLAELKRSSGGNSRPGPYDLKDRGGNRNNDFNGGRNNMRGDWGGGFGANNTLGFNNLPNDFNGGRNNVRGDWGGGFGANNTLGFNNLPNDFNGGRNNVRGDWGSGGNVGFNNSQSNFGNDFGDFGNFGNNRNNNNNNGGGGGGSDFGGNSNISGRSNFGNFGNGNNAGGNNGGFNNGGFNNGGFNNGGFNNGGFNNFGPIGGGRNDNDYFVVHMRGLPYTSYDNDVFKFFDPLRPAQVRINFNKKGLHSGSADVFFETYEDAQQAMKRHREQMGSRYIELFFDGKGKGNNKRI